MQSWKLVLRAPACALSTRSGPEDFGRVLSIPDPCTSFVSVEMHPGGNLRTVHMAWNDRPEGFASFLEYCGAAFQLHVGVCGSNAVSYSLYVNEEEAERQFEANGYLHGEPFVVATLQRFLADATLPKDHRLDVGSSIGGAESVDGVACAEAAGGAIGASSGAPELLGWTPSLPLRSTQRASVRWLQDVEQRIIGEQNRLHYSSCVPLTSRLGFDPANATILASRSHAECVFRGAVLTNDVGTGKTCCILRLVAEQCAVASAHHVTCTEDSHARIPSRATLVICPLGLQQHWKDEAQKFAPRMNVVSLTTVKEARQLTLQSLLECDMVLTTTNWIRSRANAEMLEELVRRTLALQPSCAHIVRHGTAAAARALLRNGAGGSCAAALGIVHFRRCVVDEAHDVLGSTSTRRERLRACRATSARIWVALTATPNLSDAAALQEWAGLLFGKVYEEERVHPCLVVEMERVLIKNFAAHGRRLTRRIVHRVRAGRLEKALLNCCHALAGGRADVTRSVKTSTAAGAFFAESGRSNTLEAIADSAHAMMRDRIVEAQEEESAGADAALRSDAARKVQCLTSALELLEDARSGASEPCGASDASHASHGAKLDAVASFLVSSGAERSVVVSAWKPVLQQLQEVMHASGVATEILEGASSRRDAALRRFREGSSARALLLHTHGGFAGVDLSVATHVIFMHPLTEAVDEANRVQHQVIGRVLRGDDCVHVCVHYFLLAGSDEDSLWLSQNRDVIGSAQESEGASTNCDNEPDFRFEGENTEVQWHSPS